MNHFATSGLRRWTGGRINPSSVGQRAHLLAGIPLIAGDFFSPPWSCVNAAKQSGGININVVITALRGHSGPGQSEAPCEQREERKSSLHLRPHTCRMADVPRHVTFAREARRLCCTAAIHPHIRRGREINGRQPPEVARVFTLCTCMLKSMDFCLQERLWWKYSFNSFTQVKVRKCMSGNVLHVNRENVFELTYLFIYFPLIKQYFSK